MNTAEIRARDDGSYQVSGPVVFATAGALLDASLPLFDGAERLRMDLSGVTQVDGAGLALLIEWLRQARLGGREIQFTGIPERLRAIARLTGVDDIIETHIDG